MSYVVLKSDGREFAFACNTVDKAFGPLCYVPETYDIDEIIEEFLEHLGADPRTFSNGALTLKYNQFCERRF